MKKRIKYTDEPMELRLVKDFLPPPEKLRFRQTAVKVTYDTRTDTLHFLLRDARISESREVAAGVIVDYDDEGKVAGFELLDASKRATNPKAIEFAVA